MATVSAVAGARNAWAAMTGVVRYIEPEQAGDAEVDFRLAVGAEVVALHGHGRAMAEAPWTIAVTSDAE